MQHPFSKFISIKSRLSEHLFKKCGKQEKGQHLCIGCRAKLQNDLKQLRAVL